MVDFLYTIIILFIYTAGVLRYIKIRIVILYKKIWECCNKRQKIKTPAIFVA